MTTLCRSNEATKLEKVVGIVKTQLVLICTTTNDSLSSAIWFVQTITFSKEARADPLICCDVCLCNVTQSDPHLRRKNRRPAFEAQKPPTRQSSIKTASVSNWSIARLQSCPAVLHHKKTEKGSNKFGPRRFRSCYCLVTKTKQKNQQIQFT